MKKPPVRLQKLLAGAGVASRREAERLIADGHVAVNGIVVREPGSAAVPGRDTVTVDGVPVPVGEERPHTYLLLHKPRGFVSTVRDPHAERTVMALLPRNLPRVYPVGRLDRDSEGLLLFTDDGDLTERLLHPRNGIEREYAVLVRGDFTGPAVPKLRQGVTVEGVRVKPLSVDRIPPPPGFAGPMPLGSRWLSIVLGEGRKREVRALCAAVHLYVFRLVRVRFGPLELGDLPPGETRPLTRPELRALGVGRKSAAKRRPEGPPAARTAPGKVARPAARDTAPASAPAGRPTAAPAPPGPPARPRRSAATSDRPRRPGAGPRDRHTGPASGSAPRPPARTRRVTK